MKQRLFQVDTSTYKVFSGNKATVFPYYVNVYLIISILFRIR